LERKIGNFSVASSDALKQLEHQMGVDIDNVTERSFQAFDCGVVKMFFYVKFGERSKTRYLGVIPQTAYDKLIKAVMDHDCER